MPFSFDIHANVPIFGPGFVPYVHSLLASLVHIEISPFFPLLCLSDYYAQFKILI